MSNWQLTIWVSPNGERKKHRKKKNSNYHQFSSYQKDDSIHDTIHIQKWIVDRFFESLGSKNCLSSPNSHPANHHFPHFSPMIWWFIPYFSWRNHPAETSLAPRCSASSPGDRSLPRSRASPSPMVNSQRRLAPAGGNDVAIFMVILLIRHNNPIDVYPHQKVITY